MIAPQHDDGVFGQLQFIQRGHQSADLRVHKRNGGVVRLQRLAQRQFVQVVVRHGTVVREGGRGNVIAIAFGRVRQPHVLERIHLEIFFRRHIRRVRTEETDPQKKRLLRFSRHQLNGLGGDHAIGLLLIRALCCEPTECSADLTMRFGVED